MSFRSIDCTSCDEEHARLASEFAAEDRKINRVPWPNGFFRGTSGLAPTIICHYCSRCKLLSIDVKGPIYHCGKHEPMPGRARRLLLRPVRMGKNFGLKPFKILSI